MYAYNSTDPLQLHLLPADSRFVCSKTTYAAAATMLLRHVSLQLPRAAAMWPLLSNNMLPLNTKRVQEQYQQLLKRLESVVGLVVLFNIPYQQFYYTVK